MFERIILIGECREEGVIEESLIPQRREIPNNQGADVLDELNVAGARRGCLARRSRRTARGCGSRVPMALSLRGSRSRRLRDRRGRFSTTARGQRPRRPIRRGPCLLLTWTWAPLGLELKATATVSGLGPTCSTLAGPTRRIHLDSTKRSPCAVLITIVDPLAAVLRRIRWIHRAGCM